MLVRVDFNVPLEEAGSPTTRGSGPRCRRSRRCASAARRSCWSRISAGPRASTRSCRWRPVARAAVRAARRRRRARARRRRPRRRAPWRSGCIRATCCCSRTSASSRGRPRTIPELAPALADLADVYVDDAFGAAHRAHASTEGAPRLMPDRAAGLLLEREVEMLTGLLENPSRPLRRRPRRRQGERQDRRDRVLSAHRRHDPDRRRDVLSVPGRPGSRGRRLAVRARGRRAGAPRRSPAPRSRASIALPSDLVVGRSLRRRRDAAARSTASTCPTG